MMNDDSYQAKFEEFLRTAGADLERSFREVGTPLPIGLTGIELVRGMIQETRTETDSETAQRVRRELMAEITPIIERLEGELPGGRSNPRFTVALRERLEQWVREQNTEH